MNAIQQLRAAGQSIWLDNITRTMLDDGSLRGYLEQFSVTGLTSNPTIFNEAIASSAAYDPAVKAGLSAGKTPEATFVALAIDDLRRAADLFAPVFTATGGRDGYVSLEVSPLLAADTAGTIEAAARIHRQADRPNLLVKIPGTAAGLRAIEESIFAGVPVNVTLLFSREQYLAAADAYLRGIERRLRAGLDPGITSVASLFVSRWDKAVNDRVPAALRNRLGIAVAGLAYRSYRELLDSPRWQRLASAGARPQKLLWASTGTKDPGAPDTLYVAALAYPETINTVPEKTLRAFADHGVVSGTVPADGGGAEDVIDQFRHAGIEVRDLGAVLQRAGAAAFVASWNELIARISGKAEALLLARKESA
jgi:transaldolase